MDEGAIYAKLNEIFRDIFDDDSVVLTPDTNADDIPEWDSFNHVNITVACEAAFGIRFKSAGFARPLSSCTRLAPNDFDTLGRHEFDAVCAAAGWVGITDGCGDCESGDVVVGRAAVSGEVCCG